MAHAVTTTSGITTSNSALSQHLWDHAEPSLINNTVLWQLGTPAIIPPNQGEVAHIPTFNTASAANGVQEQAFKAASATPTQTDMRALLFDKRTITLRKYVDSFGIEDRFATTATLRDYLERGSLFLTSGLAERMGTYVLFGDATAGVGIGEDDSDAAETAVMWVEPNADGSAHGTVVATDIVAVEGFFKARKKLRLKKAQGFAQFGNKYVAVIGPETTFRLQTNAVAGKLSFQDMSMKMPDQYRDAAVASFAQMVFLETTHDIVDSGDPTTPSYGFATAVTDSEVNLILAADAFYTTAIQGMPARFILHKFGEGGGIVDVADEWASLAIKAYVGFLAGDRKNKVVQMPVPLA